jgi:hypothetical protein
MKRPKWSSPRTGMFGQQGGVLSCETGPWMAGVDGGIPEKKEKKKERKMDGAPGLSVTGGAGRRG